MFCFRLTAQTSEGPELKENITSDGSTREPSQKNDKDDDESELPVKANVSLFAATYTQFKSVQDDGPENFVQQKFYLSWPLVSKATIDADHFKLVFLRNVLLPELEFSSINSEKNSLMNFVEPDSLYLSTSTGSDTLVSFKKYVNTFDLLRYASFRWNNKINILTMIVATESSNKEFLKIYFDGQFGMIKTIVNDTLEKIKRSVNSMYIGGAISIASRFTKSVTGGIIPNFQISVSALNLKMRNNAFQQINTTLESDVWNGKKRAITDLKKNPWIFTEEAKISWYISSKENNSSTIYLRLAYSHNNIPFASETYYNNQFYAQVGLDLDIIGVIKGNAKSKEEKK